MSTEPFIGEIKILGFSFAPVGYRSCDGSLLSIAEYTALFALVGTYYGGDGQVTFGIPDLRGRRSIGQGQGAGLLTHDLGEVGGRENFTILTSNLPQHTHAITPTQAIIKFKASSAVANQNTASNNFNATPALPYYKNTATAGEYLGATEISGTTEIAGGSQPFSLLNPSLTMNFSIALEGIFPSRN